MKYLYVLFVISAFLLFSSCRENSQTRSKPSSPAENLETEIDRIELHQWNQNNGQPDQSVEIVLKIKNKTDHTADLNLYDASRRIDAGFSARLKKPDRLVDLFPANKQEIERQIPPKDSISLNLRIMRDWKAEDLEGLLEEFNREFSGKYVLYLMNLAGNSYSIEVDLDRIERRFYKNNQELQLRE